MDPLIGASLISGGSALLGGALTDRSNRRAEERALGINLANAAEDRRLQREFAQSGIRWRVDDARKAGVHPLVALGAQVTPYTPLGQSGQSFTGSVKGDAVRAAGAALAESVARRDKEKAETRLLNAQADLVQQQAADSQLARIAQNQVNDVIVPGFHDVTNPKFTPRLVVPFFGDVEPGPTSDAQTFEDRYGELGGSFIGLGNVASDFKNTIKQRGRRFFNRAYERDPVYYTYE